MADSFNIDNIKLFTDYKKYFKLFDRHIPTSLTGNIMIFSIGNTSTIDLICAKNPKARYIIIDEPSVRNMHVLYLGSKYSIRVDETNTPDNFPVTDMKFDCIIMNPPYDGNKNLYGKITLEATKHAKTVVSLTPYLNYLSSAKRKSVKEVAAELMKTLKTYEKIDGSLFDAHFDANLGVFVFDENVVSPADIEELYWERFSNISMAKVIKNKLAEMCKQDSCYNHIVNKNKFDEYSYKVAYCGIRGNVHADGTKKWDWTTILGTKQRVNFTLKAGDKLDLCGFPFKSEEECKNFVKYTDTDIFNFCVYMQKNSMNTDKCIFEIIPYLPDFTHEWTEKEIAEFIGLTDEELAYIREEMKDFGWKTRA